MPVSAPFVGRASELQKIYDDLARPLGKGYHLILNVFGIGGCGKTSLLRQVRKKASTAGTIHTSFAVDEDCQFTSIAQFVGELAKSFHSTLPKHALAFDKLHDKVRQWRELNKEFELIWTPAERSQLEDYRQKIVDLLTKKTGRSWKLPKFQLGSFKLDLGVVEGQEFAGDRALSALQQGYNDLVDEITKKRWNGPGKQEFLQRPGPQLASTFVSCLEDSVYPGILGGVLGRHNNNRAPLKILFVIDTYEKISDEVGDWFLDSLLPELSRHKDVLDARFLISGRSQLSRTDLLRRWSSRYEEHLLEIELDPFTPEEVASYCQECGIPADRLQAALDETYGWPYLLKLWGDTQGADSASAFLQARDRVFWWKEPEHKKWITAASFLECFDVDGLEVFLGRTEAIEAFAWLKDCHEVTRPVGSRLAIHPIVRKVMQRAAEAESPTIFQDYAHRAQTYQALAIGFPDVAEKMPVQKLALFRYFDQHVLNAVFSHEGRDLFAFAQSRPQWFENAGGAIQMRSPWRERFNDWWSWVDSTKLAEYRHLIAGAWVAREAELRSRLASLSASLAAGRERERVANEKIAERKAQARAMDSVKREQSLSFWRSPSTLVRVAAICLGVVVGLVAFLFLGYWGRWVGLTVVAGGVATAIVLPIRPSGDGVFSTLQSPDCIAVGHTDDDIEDAEAIRLRQEMQQVQTDIQAMEKDLGRAYI